MRHGRAKASRKTLQFYRLNAPHIVSNPPYKLLLDGTFLVASIRNKVPLYERFSKILQNESFICCVTRTTLVELEALANKWEGGEEADTNLFAIARQYGLDECEIIESDKVPTTTTSTTDNAKKWGNNNKAFKGFSQASQDIYQLSTVNGNNQLAYFVATQDDALSDALRSQPYVPLFRLGRAVLLLESPSSASRKYTGTLERSKLSTAGGLMTSEERTMVNKVKKIDRMKRKEDTKEEQKRLEKRSRDEIGGGFTVRRKKKAKGPNPLSVKKKK